MAIQIYYRYCIFFKKKNNNHNNNNSGSSQSSIACIKTAFNIAKTTLDVNVCLFVFCCFFNFKQD